MLHVQRYIVGKECFADAEAFIDKALGRLEMLSCKLRAHNVLLYDLPKTLVINVLQERIARLILFFVQTELFL